MYLKWDINKLILRNVFKNIGFSIEEFGTVYFLYLKAAIHASVHYVVHLLQIKSCVIFKVRNLPLPPPLYVNHGPPILIHNSQSNA